MSPGRRYLYEPVTQVYLPHNVLVYGRMLIPRAIKDALQAQGSRTAVCAAQQVESAWEHRLRRLSLQIEMLADYD